MAEGERRTVLVVDDELAIVEALGEILGWEGYDVRSASNGRQALERIRERRPDAILLDLMMPVMDGLQVTAALEADPALRDIPVILMSAAPLPSGSPGRWAAQLKKPFDVDELREALERALSWRGAAAR